ncbi:hypothetical protein, partial [Nonomuraea basaltis]|uniref:hypothetical protein n=1 Tax=Nonomuraea basaltis TaxID=2495887 RepID=UPI00110C6CB8
MTVVGRVMAAGIIAAGTIVLGGSAQAAAVTRADSSGQITSPSDGQVVSGSSVTVSARTGLMQLRMGLYVEGPSTPTQKVAGGGANQTISGTFDAGNAPNGTFTVTLKGEITGTRYANSTFKLRRPAEAPGNVNASLQGTAKVLVTWSKGSEPDLQSYEVSNTQSGVVGRLPVDSVCSGGSCEAALAVPAKAAGQKVGFTVKAFRGDGDGGSIGSNDSGPAYVTVPAPPAAQPKKETTKTRQTPKDTKKVDPLPTLPAKKQTQPTSKPTTRKPTTTSKLPAIPDTDSDGNLPIPTADDQGETDGLTPAGTKDGKDAPVQADGVKAQSSESPIGNIGQYGLYIAGGLLLLLLGAHAGAWARRRALATEGGRRPQPPAATTAATAVAVPDGGEAVGVGGVPGEDDSVPAATAPPRRRPAVILAVAKTRVPDQAHAQGASSADGSRAQRASSVDRPLAHQPAFADRPRAHEPASVDRPHVHEASSADGRRAHGPSSADRSRAQEPFSVDRPGVHEPSSADTRRAQEPASAGRARLHELPQPAALDQGRKVPAAVLPLGEGGERAVQGRKAGEVG